jgi:hypothetical protein
VLFQVLGQESVNVSVQVLGQESVNVSAQALVQVLGQE